MCIRWSSLLLFVAISTLIACSPSDTETAQTTTDITTDIPAPTSTPEPTTTPNPTATPAPTDTPTPSATPLPDCASKEILCVGGIIEQGSEAFSGSMITGLEQVSEDANVYSLVPETSDDLTIAIGQLVAQHYDLILVTGFNVRNVVTQAAQTNQDTNFVILDATEPVNLPNVAVVTLEVDEAAFLAGYLAAGMSQTGVIGTWGGENVPSISMFMNGYRCGAAYYNAQNDTNVAVVGTGSYINNFSDTTAGRQITETLLVGGADIVMPVAGGAGLGAAEVAAEQDILVIGVDNDWVETYPETSPVVLTSVLKNFDAATVEVVRAIQQNGFEAGVYHGTLANGGVALAPFHDLAPQVPEELKVQLSGIRQSIAEEMIDTCGS